MPKPSPTRYRTTNWSDYYAALRKRGSLLIWLDKDMTWLAPREGRPGRPPVFSDAAIQFCLSIKGKGVPELVRGTNSALNGRSPGQLPAPLTADLRNGGEPAAAGRARLARA